MICSLSDGHEMIIEEWNVPTLKALLAASRGHQYLFDSRIVRSNCRD